jgi:ABC-type branched-subunit amino acid transport system substrate-binding protein
MDKRGQIRYAYILRSGFEENEGEEIILRRSNVLSVVMASVLLATTMGLASCGGDDKASFDLTIGDVVPLTGALSDFGPPGRKAADLAVAEINKAIKEANVDHTVKIQHEDEETDSQATLSAGRKRVDAGATCIAGAWASADTIPLAESVSIKEQVVQISPASTAASIAEIDDDGYLMRTAPPDTLQAKALADHMDKELGGAQGKTINIGSRNDFYGEGLADALPQEWEARGGKVGEKVLYDPEQPSFNSEAAKITSGNPDAFVIIDFPETYAKVGPALVRTGNFDASKTFVTDGLASTSLPKDAGAEATEGLRGTSVGTFSGASPKQFDTLYKAAKGPDRQTFDAQNFDAVMLCYLAAVAAGSADGDKIKDEVRNVSGPPGTKYTIEQLPEAIEALDNGDDIDYEGAIGAIDLDENGDPGKWVYDIIEFQDGKLETLRQVTPEAGAPGTGL